MGRCRHSATGQQHTHLPSPTWYCLLTKLAAIQVKWVMAMLAGKKKVPRGTVPKESAPTNDNHFTLLGFTAATGESVISAIFWKEKLSILRCSDRHQCVCPNSINVFAQIVGNETDPDLFEQHWTREALSIGANL